MKKLFRYFIISLIAVVLSSCTKSNIDNLADFIQSPKQDSPIIEGTWQVVDITNEGENNEDSEIKINDMLYVNKNLVAINNSYAFPPSFTSKYVKLADYLKNRGIKTSDDFGDRSVVVLTASQGQLFSKDLIITDKNNLFIIKDDHIISLKKISDKIDSQIIDKYAKLASKERSTSQSGEEVAEDMTMLLGVRERIDPDSDKALYRYYTYMIRIKSDDTINYQKVANIFLKRKDEYWRVSSDLNNFTDLYDDIKSYPIKIENNIENENENYSFKDINLNTRINYVSKDFISIDYTNNLNIDPIRKYALLETENLGDKKFISLKEFTGEKDSDIIFKEKVKNEVKKAFPNVNPDKVGFDSSNFGIVRSQGMWVFQSSINTGHNDEFVQNFFNVDIAIGDSILNPTNNIINRDQVYNINTQFKDYVVLDNLRYIAIQTPDEILIHRIKDGLIEKSPIYAIPTRMPCTIISIDQYSGSSASDLEKAFEKYNDIIEK